MKNKYFLTAVCMYLNYIVIGVSVIILSMNMDALMEQFGTDRTGFGLVVSGIGIGKFIVLFISGVLSDKFGRKPFILIGMVGFIVYFMGILLSPNVPIALFFAVLAGMCNSFIDAGDLSGADGNFSDISRNSESSNQVLFGSRAVYHAVHI